MTGLSVVPGISLKIIAYLYFIQWYISVFVNDTIFTFAIDWIDFWGSVVFSNVFSFIDLFTFSVNKISSTLPSPNDSISIAPDIFPIICYNTDLLYDSLKFKFDKWGHCLNSQDLVIKPQKENGNEKDTYLESNRKKFWLSSQGKISLWKYQH